MKNIVALVSGKKTYVIGILSIILGILNGDTQLIMTGLTAITLRAGISKM